MKRKRPKTSSSLLTHLTSPISLPSSLSVLTVTTISIVLSLALPRPPRWVPRLLLLPLRLLRRRGWRWRLVPRWLSLEMPILITWLVLCHTALSRRSRRRGRHFPILMLPVWNRRGAWSFRQLTLLGGLFLREAYAGEDAGLCLAIRQGSRWFGGRGGRRSGGWVRGAVVVMLWFSLGGARCLYISGGALRRWPLRSRAAVVVVGARWLGSQFLHHIPKHYVINVTLHKKTQQKQNSFTIVQQIIRIAIFPLYQVLGCNSVKHLFHK